MVLLSFGRRQEAVRFILLLNVGVCSALIATKSGRYQIYFYCYFKLVQFIVLKTTMYTSNVSYSLKPNTTQNGLR